MLFGLEELEEFSMVDETDTQAAGGDLGRSTAPLEKWGWIMFECGIENLTVKGDSSKSSLILLIKMLMLHFASQVAVSPALFFTTRSA